MTANEDKDSELVEGAFKDLLTVLNIKPTQLIKK